MNKPDPFRVAFVLAALTALRAIGPDVAPGIGDIATHPNELIFGFFSIQLFGFLTVALPRWIGRPITPAPMLWAVLIAHAAAFAWGCIDLDQAGFLRALVTLSGVVLLLSVTPPGKTAETLPILGLAALHGLIGIPAFLYGWPEATMAGLAVIVLICIEVSNRIGIAVLAVARERAGYPKLKPVPTFIALPQRVFTILALALWGLGWNAGWPALAAFVFGVAWLVHIQPWRIKPYAGCVILAVGLVWKRLAFLLLALKDLDIADVSPFAVIHAFAVGGLVTLAIGIATSIVRKKDKRSLMPSLLADIIYVAIASAAIARVGAAIDFSLYDTLIPVARWSWAVAFLGYVLFTLRGAIWPPATTKV
ncbi:NnrS family protein [Pleomorphomonas sp. JP5]|uniref:NnrS family protein n=1 Tax=Pleomorphomonas sp. JP5 TaxID=2942998 RepID=UPI002044AFF2|nr:NnrS family protein [Pleomorphomonas sp. JP5]MCM5556485.1 NnrS family protein [Pleomorphomonas sp. JP5]